MTKSFKEKNTFHTFHTFIEENEPLQCIVFHMYFVFLLNVYVFCVCGVCGVYCVYFEMYFVCLLNVYLKRINVLRGTRQIANYKVITVIVIAKYLSILIEKPPRKIPPRTAIANEILCVS